VGRLVPTEEGAASEVSEWELREREEVTRAEARELGAAGELSAGEELPQFLPAPSFMAPADDDWGASCTFFCFSLLSLSFVRTLFRCEFFGAHHILLGRPGRRAMGSLQRATTARTADGESG